MKIAAVGLLLLATSGSAVEPTPNYQVPTATYWISGAGIALTAVARLGLSSPTQSNWKGGIWIDNSTRSFIRGDHVLLDQVVSDIFTIGLATYPFLGDTLGRRALGYGSKERTWAQSLMWLQAMSVTAGTSQLIKRVVARQRPYVSECPSHSNCDRDDSFESFPSGHTTFAFAGAGLLCVQNKNPWVCGGGITVAIVAGASRVSGDVHYLSDVVGGATLGTLIGVGLTSWVWSSDGAPMVTPTAQGTGIDVTWNLN